MTLYDSVGVDLEGFPALVVKTYNGGQGLRQSDHDLPLCYTKGPNMATWMEVGLWTEDHESSDSAVYWRVLSMSMTSVGVFSCVFAGMP